jgi:NitT/TauT family transport system substrate-binding protein
MHVTPRRGRLASFALALILLVLALVTVACGDDEDDATTEAAPATTAAATSEAAAPAEPAETAPAETSAPAESSADTAAAETTAEAASSFEGEPTKISFLYSPFTDYAPFFIAEEKGYFDEFGVDVDLATKTGTSETIQLLATGQADAGGSTWGSAFFNSIGLGSKVQIVGQLATMPEAGVKDPSPLIVAKQVYDGGVTTVADLKGKKIGQPGPGGFGEYSIHLALQTAGLTLDDVEIVNIGPPEAAAALTNGGVDATWTIEPFATLLENEGVALPISSGHAAGVELGFVAFNADFVEANEDAVVRFTAAYIKAARELDGGGWDDPEIKEIISKYTELPVETLDQLGRTIRNEDGAVDLESVREQEAFFRERGQLEYEGEADIDSVNRVDIQERALALLGG